MSDDPPLSLIGPSLGPSLRALPRFERALSRSERILSRSERV